MFSDNYDENVNYVGNPDDFPNADRVETRNQVLSWINR